MVDIHHPPSRLILTYLQLIFCHLFSLIFVFLFFCVLSAALVCLLGPVASCCLVWEHPTPALGAWDQGQLDQGWCGDLDMQLNGNPGSGWPLKDRKYGESGW